MDRVVTPEILDHLPVEAPEAVRSRSDLRRVNALMRHAAIIGAALARRPCERLVDLGAGDGRLSLQIARASPASPRSVTLVDRQHAVSAGTLRQFGECGVRAEIVTADVFDFLESAARQPGTAMVANLFLHHFSDRELKRLLGLAAERCDLFIACEPRRAALPAIAAALLGAIGCSAVTRHDARVSVRAGFVGAELSRLWPVDDRWKIEESEAGLFSHRFVAERRAI